MPTYNYRCAACGAEFERVQRMSEDPIKDIEATRRYLSTLRSEMGRAVADLESFEVAYDKADFSNFDREPTFDVANRINAYNVYLEMERESLESAKP